MPQDTKPEDIEQLRTLVMEGLASIPAFAAAIGKSERGVRRMAAIGQIQLTRFGATSYVQLESVKRKVAA